METGTLTRLTYADYLELPEVNQPYAIVDGEMITAPSPNVDHQWISTNIFAALSEHVKSRRLGIVLFSPIDVLIRREPLRIRQPDVLYLNADRTGIKGRSELRNMVNIQVAPDLVVEIQSPSESRSDIKAKLKDFQSIGTQEAWVVHPKTRTVEVLRLTVDPWETIGLYRSGQQVASEVLPDLILPVDTVFA